VVLCCVVLCVAKNHKKGCRRQAPATINSPTQNTKNWRSEAKRSGEISALAPGAGLVGVVGFSEMLLGGYGMAGERRKGRWRALYSCGKGKGDFLGIRVVPDVSLGLPLSRSWHRMVLSRGGQVV
jgi:hypothetical protein